MVILFSCEHKKSNKTAIDPEFLLKQIKTLKHELNYKNRKEDRKKESSCLQINMKLSSNPDINLIYLKKNRLLLHKKPRHSLSKHKQKKIPPQVGSRRGDKRAARKRHLT